MFVACFCVEVKPLRQAASAEADSEQEVSSSCAVGVQEGTVKLFPLALLWKAQQDSPFGLKSPHEHKRESSVGFITFRVQTWFLCPLLFTRTKANVTRPLAEAPFCSPDSKMLIFLILFQMNTAGQLQRQNSANTESVFRSCECVCAFVFFLKAAFMNYASAA